MMTYDNDTGISTPEIMKNMTMEVASHLGEYDVAQTEAEVKAILDPATCPKIVEMTGVQAGHIYLTRNVLNRDISSLKVGVYTRAMERGEWLENHQGLAFYPDGTLGDGQHRLVAMALSGYSQKLIIYMGFTKEAIQTIDQGKPRNAGEALKMDGIHDGAVKSSSVKLSKEYQHQKEHGVRPTYSQIQIVKEVKEHKDLLQACTAKADELLVPVTDAPLKKSDLVLHLFLMVQYGHFEMEKSAEFLDNVLTGTATYPDAPQLVLSRVLTRAKHGAKNADKLNGISRIAVIQKAASLWAEGKTCSKLTWSKKEGLPLASATPTTDEG